MTSDHDAPRTTEQDPSDDGAMALQPVAPHRLPGLDSLRGMAVVAVVAYHLGHLRGGFLGVDVFFVLSGFLVTSIALGEVDRSGRIDLRAFWGRRVRRLAPALFVMVPVVVAATLLVGRGRGTLGRLGWDAAATSTWWMNWRQAFGDTGGYWDPAPSLFRHAWSLSIEEQFYLLWPLALAAAVAVAARGHRTRTVGAVAAVGAVLSGSWSVVLAHRLGDGDLSRVYVGTDTRIVAPLVGCALAAALHRRAGADLQPGTRQSMWPALAGGAAVIGLGIAMAAVSVDDPVLYRSGLLPAVAVLAAVAVVGARSLSRTDPVTRWLGRRSYAIYLWSWPIQILALQHDPEISRTALSVLVVVGSLALAEVSWWLVEAPAQRRSGWASVAWSRRSVSVALAAGAIAAVAVPFGRYVPDGFVEGPSAAEALERAHDAPESVPSAPGEQRRTVAVFGDSVAFTMVFHAPWPGSIDGIRSIDGQGVIGCGLLASSGYDGLAFGGADWSPPREECEVQDEMEQAALDREPDVVLVFSGAWEYPGTRTPDGTVLAARSEPYARAIIDDLVSTAARADAVGSVTMFVSFACPGAEGDAPARKDPEYLRWYDDVLHRAASEAGDAGYRAEVLEATDEVCIDADPTGAPTPDKDVAFNHEVHVQDTEGATWAWQTWLGPAITEATSDAP